MHRRPPIGPIPEDASCDLGHQRGPTTTARQTPLVGGSRSALRRRRNPGSRPGRPRPAQAAPPSGPSEARQRAHGRDQPRHRQRLPRAHRSSPATRPVASPALVDRGQPDPRDEPQHDLRGRRRHDRRVDVHVVHPAGRADDRDAERGGPRRERRRATTSSTRAGPTSRDRVHAPRRLGVPRARTSTTRPPATPRSPEYWIKKFERRHASASSAPSPRSCPSLVSPAGIEDIDGRTVRRQPSTRVADQLSDGRRRQRRGRHRRPPRPRGRRDRRRSRRRPTRTTPFGQIVLNADDDIDAIVSGHTHLAYNHVIDDRPVISSGQYGERFSNMEIRYDPQVEVDHLDGEHASTRWRPRSTLPATSPRGSPSPTRRSSRSCRRRRRVADRARQRRARRRRRPTSAARLRRDPVGGVLLRRRTAAASPRSATSSPTSRSGR